MAVANGEEDIDQTKAPLIEHLIELRRRLIYCIVTVLVFFVFCYAFAQDIYNFLLIPWRLAVGGDAPIELIYTAPQEFFLRSCALRFLARSCFRSRCWRHSFICSLPQGFTGKSAGPSCPS